MYFVAETITLNINCFNDDNCEGARGALAIDFHDCCTERLAVSYQNLTTDTCMICPGLKLSCLTYVHNIIYNYDSMSTYMRA